MDEDDYRDKPHASDDPAAAFDRLRGEVSLLRSAIEGLTAARESIDIPDYEPTLERTEKILGVLARQMAAMRQSPAMTLTPENMGSRLNASVAETVNAVRGQAQASKSALDGAISDLRSVVLSARRADEQNRWLYMIGGGGVLMGLLLYAILAGPIARLAPVSWQWPERAAARTLGLPRWEAGQRLMQSASPAAFRAIVAGDRIVTANRETIEGCSKAAARTRESVRCMIQVDNKP